MRVGRVTIVLALAVAFGAGAVVERVGATGTVVAGDPTQVQLLSVPDSPGSPADCTLATDGYYCQLPQPATNWYSVPGTVATVSVPTNTHAVVSYEGRAELDMNANPEPSVTALCHNAAQLNAILVDGVATIPQGIPGMKNLDSLIWTQRLGPGNHTVAWGISCTTADPADAFFAHHGPIRVERIKVP
jgi:hypothetical protein